MEKGVLGDEGPVSRHRSVEQGVILRGSQEWALMRRVKMGQFSTTGARAMYEKGITKRPVLGC